MSITHMCTYTAIIMLPINILICILTRQNIREPAYQFFFPNYDDTWLKEASVSSQFYQGVSYPREKKGRSAQTEKTSPNVSISSETLHISNRQKKKTKKTKILLCVVGW